MLAVGSFLKDVNRGEQRFRVKELLHAGDAHQIALAEDTVMDDKLVCVKTVAYDRGKVEDKRHVAMRRKALHQELEFLALPLHLLPEPLDWIQIDASSTVLPREPVLVYEYNGGETLHQHVTTRYPTGIAPTRALRIAREVCQFLVELHAHGWVFRNLDPRHVLVGHDDVIHLVGCGNATKMQEPPNETRVVLGSPYVAPEARDEVSGQFLRPAADIYSLGALLVFMLTGDDIRDSVENPLTQNAFDRLSALETPGLSLLIARCLRPMGKERVATADALLAFLDVKSLPTPQTQGFGLLTLPAPWSGAERPEGRMATNKLSAGPLVSVSPAEVPPSAEDGAVQPAEPAQLEKSKRKQLAVVLALVAMLALVGLICVIAGLIVGV